MLDPLHPSALAGGVRDAWASLSRSARPLNVVGGEVDDLDDDADVAAAGALGERAVITASMIENELAKEKKHENEEYTLSTGQLAVACRTTALKAAMNREGELVTLLEKELPGSGKVLEGAQREVRAAASTADYVDHTNPNSASQHTALMTSFFQRLDEVKAYHSTNTAEGGADAPLGLGGSNPATAQQVGMLLSGQKRKHGHPLADGYDIASFIAAETAGVRGGEAYTPEELFGKYLDLVPLYEGEVRAMRHAFAAPSEGGEDGDNGLEATVSMLSYLDFLSILAKGLNTSIPEAAKLRDRRKYARFLRGLEAYLVSFLKRTTPFLDVATEVIAKAAAAFEKEWGEKGGVEGWECRAAEASMLSDKSASSDKENGEPSSGGIDLGKFATADDLEKGVGADELKAELARLGLKCGGAPKDRAARLFLTKGTPLDKLPAKVFREEEGAWRCEEGKDRSWMPPGGASSAGPPRRTTSGIRNSKRKSTAPPTTTPSSRRKGEAGSDDEDDEDDTPIYNPKNVPLGWDGKPIPYWLFKLHGLNHFYPCEICGNESYRGRRNFEKHFTESRHAYGMRCLAIPNTKHFHGVTKIADAQELWGNLKKVLEGNRFDVAEEEEYEDSHGNVLNRAQYEDLARQGLL
ncbi:hypothetical protein ACHAXT_001220 [Thalassiosira profunda]